MEKIEERANKRAEKEGDPLKALRLGIIAVVDFGMLALYYIFKQMESLVHGTLYNYGLIFSEEGWAAQFRAYTWMFYDVIVFVAVVVTVFEIICLFKKSKTKEGTKNE